MTLGNGKLIRAVVSVSNRGTAVAENVELTVSGDGVEARAGVGPGDRTGEPRRREVAVPPRWRYWNRARWSSTQSIWRGLPWEPGELMHP